MGRRKSSRPSEEERLDRLFHALSDRTRRRLLEALFVRPSKVTDLARPFDMSLPAVSKHLRILEEAGLLHRRIDGRVHSCRLDPAPLRAVEVWVDPYRRYWEARVRGLAPGPGAERTSPIGSARPRPGTSGSRTKAKR